MNKLLRKIRLKIILTLFVKGCSDVYCDTKGEFYGIYYSDLKKWVIENGDYCGIKQKSEENK